MLYRKFGESRSIEFLNIRCYNAHIFKLEEKFIMKKRKTEIRILSAFLAFTVAGTSLPVSGATVSESEEIWQVQMQDTEEAEYDSSAEQVDSSTETQKMTGEELFQEETSEEEDPGEKISSGEEIAEQFASGNPPVVTECFGDGEKTDTDKDTNENTDEDTEGIRYIKGRPLTEEEREAELEPIRNLTPLDAGPEVESNLTSVYAAYGDTDTAYPETYDSRVLGFVTPVKNQNPFGTCWAFGMAAVMETSLLAQKKGTYDLSEEHLSYFFSNRQNDPLGNTANDQNTVLGNYHSIGGNDYLAALFLSTWSGMTTEDDVPFPTDDSHTQDLSYEISASKAYNASAYLKNATFSSYSVDRMKEMLLKDHAVSIMFYMSENYANPDTAAYCYPVGKSSSKLINHIVTVVGWDDNYSSKNFLESSNVTSDGAWIIKNSWGDQKGDGGYYYLSYEDANISNLVSAEAETVADQKYKNNYFYDGSSAISKISLKAGQSVAAIYQATAGNGKKEALGEVNVVSMSDDSTYQIQVYTDLTDASDPESGQAAYAIPYEAEQSFAGVQTIEIPEVTLKQGSRYSVVITNAGSNTISFGVEANTSYKTSGGGSWFTSLAGIEENQTFFKGTSATAKWADGATQKWSARIKAHTRTLEESEPEPEIPATPAFTVKAYNTGYNLVSWKKVSGAEGYYVYRRPGTGGKWTRIATVKSPSLKYKDTKVTANTSYCYTVRAYYWYSGKRYLSKYKMGGVIKAAPALQKVSSVKSEKNGIRIRWKSQKKCDGYYIYRKKKGGSYQLIKKISGGSYTTYLDKNAQKGVSYYYVVKAYVKESYGRVYSKYQHSSAIKRK